MLFGLPVNNELRGTGDESGAGRGAAAEPRRQVGPPGFMKTLFELHFQIRRPLLSSCSADRPAERD